MPYFGGVAEVTRSSGFLPSLRGFGLRTDGAGQIQQIKSVEQVPEVIIQPVLDWLAAVLEDN